MTTGGWIGLVLISVLGVAVLGLFGLWCWWMITGANDLARESSALRVKGATGGRGPAPTNPPPPTNRRTSLPECKTCYVEIASDLCPHTYRPADGTGHVIMSQLGHNALVSELSNLRNIIATRDRSPVTAYVAFLGTPTEQAFAPADITIIRTREDNPR